jgi:hypothetical protein
MTPEENKRIIKLEDDCLRLKTLVENVLPLFIVALSAMSEDNIGRRSTMNRFIRFALPQLDCDEELKQQFVDGFSRQESILEKVEVLFDQLKNNLPSAPPASPAPPRP